MSLTVLNKMTARQAKERDIVRMRSIMQASPYSTMDDWFANKLVVLRDKRPAAILKVRRVLE